VPIRSIVLCALLFAGCARAMIGNDPRKDGGAPIDSDQPKDLATSDSSPIDDLARAPADLVNVAPPDLAGAPPDLAPAPSDLAGGPLDPGLALPDPSGAVCATPGSLSECPGIEVCRFYSAQSGRCEACTTCNNLGAACSASSDCDILFMCYLGKCTNFCQLGTSECGPVANCLNIGHPTYGVCK
jgi:hypothetical protein